MRLWWSIREIIRETFGLRNTSASRCTVLLDEINLQKSVAVCSKNLTYVSLTDFDDDGSKSVDINEQATHDVSTSYRCLCNRLQYSLQKIPSKETNSRNWVVKAISYLERCGAMIHGVIADSAATNMKMWSLLGIRRTMEDTKMWFTHPMDDERKIFVFSNICHVFKNIRNRLYNKKKLRVNFNNIIP